MIIVMVMPGVPHGGDFSLSGLVIVKKMVANYNTAFSQYQRI
jgi:hypothetical protein